MKKIILYISPLNKKNLCTQYHVEAEDLKDAISLLEKQTTDKFKVIGMRDYPENLISNFINNKFI